MPPPPPSAAFILKVSEFYFLFLVLFFLPFPPPFLFFVLFFYHPCHNFVLEGTCFIIASFAHIETGTHPCVYFQKSALVTPQAPDISLPHQVPPSCVHEGVWGGEVVVETRDRHQCLEGFLNYI